ncbi:hypothetical protein CK203_063523 [Vitis vinifera]|uniref:Uncharacterized protein n=1 Tax=Vitis vinifera TaxID=29760 RepID=A0A438G614_VITVI|nr:hypothetical protein CK203_063523 [Vitis vinifera]
MAKTRGGLSGSPSSPTPRPHRAAMGAATSPPVQAPAIPPSEGKPLLSADTPPGDHPRTSATSRSSHELCFSATSEEEPSSRVLESHPTHLSQSHLQRTLGFLPPNPTLIQFTIDGRQGAIGARHIAEALRIPYEPVIQADFREWSSFSQSDMVRILSRGTSTASVLTRRELPSGMLLIDVLLRANLFPLQHKRKSIRRSFKGQMHPITISEAPLPDFRAPGYPEQPRLERPPLPRGLLSRQMASLGSLLCTPGSPVVPAPPELPQDEQMPQAQQDEILTETTPPAPAAHPKHIPEPIHPISPITSGAPPRLRAFIADTEHCSGFYYPPDGHYSAHQDQIIATQAQHTTILHQIQQHLSMQTPFGHDRSAPSEPLVPDKESLPAEQPIPEEEIRAEPSHDTPHI